MSRIVVQISVLLIALIISSVMSASSQEAPKTMLKITTQRIDPQSDKGSFTGQSKTLWRAGTMYAQIEEVPDLPHHIHGLVIIAEPDAWMINLLEKAGKHVVDPGPSLSVHIPIFPTPGSNNTKESELEFGSELEFFIKNDATHSTGEVINGKPAERYEVILHGRKLRLWMDVKSKEPLRISLVSGTDSQSIEYLAYETLPFEPSLFRPPEGIAMQNSR